MKVCCHTSLSFSRLPSRPSPLLLLLSAQRPSPNGLPPDETGFHLHQLTVAASSWTGHPTLLEGRERSPTSPASRLHHPQIRHRDSAAQKSESLRPHCASSVLVPRPCLPAGFISSPFVGWLSFPPPPLLLSLFVCFPAISNLDPQPHHPLPLLPSLSLSFSSCPTLAFPKHPPEPRRTDPRQPSIGTCDGLAPTATIPPGTRFSHFPPAWPLITFSSVSSSTGWLPPPCRSFRFLA